MADLGHLHGYISSLWLLYFFCDIHPTITSTLSQSDVDQHLEMGMKLLSQGQLQEALSHFHTAIDADPGNYLSYFRRATVYLALGKAKQALPDLQQVLKMKPSFLAARVQRGNVHLKMGSLDEAHIDFEQVLNLREMSMARAVQLSQLSQLPDFSSNGLKELMVGAVTTSLLKEFHLLRQEPQHVEAASQYALIDTLRVHLHQHHEAQLMDDSAAQVALLSAVLEHCAWSAELRELRAGAQLALGETAAAVSDLRAAVKLRPDNRPALLHIATLLYSLGDAHQSLAEVRECLRLDQDDSACHKHYSKVKKVVKALDSSQSHLDSRHYDACVSAANRVLELERRETAVRFSALERVCTCLSQQGAGADAVDACSRALELDTTARLYCERADAYLNDDLFDDAIRDYQKALEIDEGFARAKKGLKRAQKLSKQRAKRDYYKILGVTRSANKREISKAYRKLAQQWHPDNFVNDDDAAKKRSEKMFIDIAAAKEVLSDPEKRNKFDNGEDPLDPESEAGRGFNPFQHGFHGFPGGSFTFHFN